MKPNKLNLIVKRIFDIIGAFSLLLLALPLFALIGIVIKINSPGEIFFKQIRIGRERMPFSIYKFRTMIKNAEFLGAGLYFEGENDLRITPVGKFLRNYSLDELPELWNVLKGDMSLVGPRPTLPAVVQNFTSYHLGRLVMKPGITGWAQINGRNNLTWSQRIALDLWYINNYSFWLDLKILVKTFKVVIFREGIRYDQNRTDVEDLTKL